MVSSLNFDKSKSALSIRKTEMCFSSIKESLLGIQKPCTKIPVQGKYGYLRKKVDFLPSLLTSFYAYKTTFWNQAKFTMAKFPLTTTYVPLRLQDNLLESIKIFDGSISSHHYLRPFTLTRQLFGIKIYKKQNQVFFPLNTQH